MRIGVLAAAADVLQGKQLLLHKHQNAASSCAGAAELVHRCADCCTLCPWPFRPTAGWVFMNNQGAAEDVCAG